MKCNGSSFDVEIHTDLALLYPNGILPDLRGLVIRGWDDGRGFDIDRLLLSFQDTAAPNIVGSVDAVTYGVISGSSSGAIHSGLANVYTRVNQVNSTAPSGFNFDASRVWGGYRNDVSEIRVRNMAFNYIMRVLK